MIDAVDLRVVKRPVDGLLVNSGACVRDNMEMDFCWRYFGDFKLYFDTASCDRDADSMADNYKWSDDGIDYCQYLERSAV